MNLIRIKRFFSIELTLFSWLFSLLFAINVAQAQNTIKFTLDKPYTTSAGVYQPDGTLVRTLWSRVPYSAGTHAASWDGKNDNGAALPTGQYQIKLLYHNVQYVWEGAIGNTSLAQSGPHVYNGYLPIRDMAATDTAMFMVAGFNEGQSSLHRFALSNPRYPSNAGRVDGFTAFSLLATDGTNVYMANNDASVNPGNHTTFVYAVKVRDNAEVLFPAGQKVQLNGNYPNQTYSSVIDLDQQSPTPTGMSLLRLANGATGLAVQKTGNILAVAHQDQNVIRLFDKLSGRLLRTITAARPGSLSMAPSGDLWAVVGGNVVRYTNLASNPSVATTITGLTKPLAVATDPSNEDLVLIADGGGSQQVKAYNRAGNGQWTYGQAGGYPVNGNEVRADKFWFERADVGETTFVTIAPDHSFWVGDIGNNRCLHFSASHSYIEQLMFQPHAYAASVDANNPNRVFSEFLEFQVDYSRPVGESWTLVRNWRTGLDIKYLGFFQGLRQVTTLPNGRTYAIVQSPVLGYEEMVELAGNRLRPTGIKPADNIAGASPTLLPDGSLNLVPFYSPPNSTVTWHRQALTGFDGAGNPQWAAPAVLASAPTGSRDPYPRPGGFGEVKSPLTSSGLVISFDYSKNNNFHLGAVKVGGTSWLWRAAPSGPLDGKGTYDIGNGVEYAGNQVVTAGRHILYGYHGEFWSGAEACQWMHFYDDGLVVGQFGETTLGRLASEGVLAGAAGNGVSPSLVVQNGETYMWVNDEGGHGPMRWHLTGLDGVREATGTGGLNSIITLNNPAATAPTQVVAAPGNAQLQLSWTAVPGTAGYTVKYARTPGGPYTTAASGLTTNTYTLGSLLNDTNYYVVVDAQPASGAKASSDEVVATPYDPAVAVHVVGSTASNYTELAVSSAAPAAGKAALHVTQPLHYSPDKLLVDTVGTKGFVIYNWGGAGADKAVVRAPFTVTKGGGWRNDNYVKILFKVDNVTGSDYSLYSNPAGSINITVSDNNWHYLTAVCPVRFDEARTNKVTLTPQGQASPAATYYINEKPGKNHIIQFRFRGNVTLTVDNQQGVGGTLQAIFLDDDVSAAPVQPTKPLTVVAAQLTGFTLVNADNNQDIKALVAGETLNLTTLPTRNLNIRATTAPATVGSVAFSLSGPQTKTVTDNGAPYSLFGDSNGQFTPWVPAAGTYTLRGTPFSDANGGGTAGSSLTTTFTVTDPAVTKPAPTPPATPAPTPTPALYRINAGGGALTTSRGAFQADAYYQPAPGIVTTTATPVLNTPDSPLYQSSHTTDNKNFSYYLAVPNGQYSVVLHFAETRWTAVGQRLFDVTFEGKKVLDNYDIYKKAGKNAATTETIAVTVNDGVLSINFSAQPSDGGVDQPLLCALEVLSGTPAPSDKVTLAAAAPATPLPGMALTAYPNPTQDGKVTVMLPQPMSGALTYTLVSAVGSILATGSVPLADASVAANFDLGAAMRVPGVYILRLRSGSWHATLKVLRSDQ